MQRELDIYTPFLEFQYWYCLIKIRLATLDRNNKIAFIFHTNLHNAIVGGIAQTISILHCLFRVSTMFSFHIFGFTTNKRIYVSVNSTDKTVASMVHDIATNVMQFIISDTTQRS